MQKIVIASNNAGKLREICAILAPFGLEAVSQKEAGFTAEVEETGTTFQENAALKARAVYEALRCPVIADDSGLMVDALDGAPGVYSHRFAGENATDIQRYEKLLELLGNKPREQRTARFVCVLCYVDEDGKEQFFTGTCEGYIGTEPLGENGFGYDPVFCCGEKTMAQMTDAEKNEISHRGNALKQLKQYFESESGYANK
ncbi:XTP/dITP diphosphatase [uncultured Ruminococcus sp.]|uniref:XTP/dITP diphosphatase n=1 Tax=uncultured Ruminococcus sp. TaxID=165186 RepID=UPI002638C4C8|nr:XTP/dITP diphosphatase [uncultured Ruminococcus sp.]